MQVKIYTQSAQLTNDPRYPEFVSFIDKHAQGNYFQNLPFFEFMEAQKEFRPLQLIAWSEDGKVMGSLLGQFQSFGGGVKGWMSRRIVVLGGPLVNALPLENRINVAKTLLNSLKRYANGRAIYIEFRNLFDTTDLQEAFEEHEFLYKPHLNYLLETDTEENVKKRMSRSRRKEIRVTLEAGARIVEPESESEVMVF